MCAAYTTVPTYAYVYVDAVLQYRCEQAACTIDVHRLFIPLRMIIYIRAYAPIYSYIRVHMRTYVVCTYLHTHPHGSYVHNICRWMLRVHAHL